MHFHFILKKYTHTSSFFPKSLNRLLARVSGQNVGRLLPVDRAVDELSDDRDDLVDRTDQLLGRISFSKGDRSVLDSCKPTKKKRKSEPSGQR